jgi:ribose-phosphate pyrophosphokinase
MGSMDMQLFVLDGDTGLGRGVAERLGVEVAPHELRTFPDGEHKIRPLVNVRGRDVYVLHSLDSDATAGVNDKLCRLLFFVGALKDAAAERVTAVVPYLCYSRKERKTKARDPITTRYVAQLFEAVGVDRVVTVDVHDSAAFQNAFRRPTENLEAAPALVARLVELARLGEVTAMSPDIGGIKRLERFRRNLLAATDARVSLGFLEKWRSRDVVTGEAVVGEVRGRVVVLIDDLIATGGTICRAARICKERGASEVYAVATHGLFAERSLEVIATSGIDRILVTNSVVPRLAPDSEIGAKLEIVDLAPTIARAVEAMHTRGSISARSIE